MNMHRFRPLSCLLLLVVILAGCAAPQPGAETQRTGEANSAVPGGTDPQASSAAMGRYIEKSLSDVKLPEAHGDTLVRQGDNGKYYAIADGGATLSVSEDLINWKEETTGYTPPDGFGVEDFAIDDSNAIIFLNSKYTGDGFVTSLQRMQGGEVTTIELPTVGGSVPTLLNVKILPSGNLLVGARDQGILQLAPDGALVRQYMIAGSYAGYDAFGDELAVLSLDEGSIAIVKLSDGVEQRRLSLPSASKNSGFLRYDAQGALYYADSMGIYRVAAGGSLLEKIVDGTLCTLSDPTAHAIDLLFDAQGRMVVPFLRYPQTQFIAYEFDENVPTEPSTVLNLFSLHDSYALQKAILLFQGEHPDVKVRWNIALSEDSSISADDAVRTLNTEVLAGKGPDIIVLDGLPIASYMEKGVLIDLSSAVQPLLDANDAFPAVVDAFRKEDARFAVATRFTLPTLFGAVEGVSTLEELARSAQRGTDKPPFADMSPEAMLRGFYLSSLPAWKDDAGRLRADAVETFLTQVRDIMGEWTPETARAAMPEDAQGIEGLTLLSYDIVTFATHTLDGGMSLCDGMGALYVSKKGGYTALPGQASGVFAPHNILGVSAASAQPDLGRAFVEMLLSDEIQDIDIFRDGFPVRKAAFDRLLAEEKAMVGMVGMSGKNDAYTSTSIAPDEAMATWARAMADSATTCSLPDAVLLQILVEETKAFFEGSASANQAAQAFVNRANAYLTE